GSAHDSRMLDCGKTSLKAPSNRRCKGCSVRSAFAAEICAAILLRLEPISYATQQIGTITRHAFLVSRLPNCSTSAISWIQILMSSFDAASFLTTTDGLITAVWCIATVVFAIVSAVWLYWRTRDVRRQLASA